jgi:hypothetical protein
VGSVHGVGKIEAGLSDYYLVDEIQGTYRGMIISIPALHWQVFETLDVTQMGKVLKDLAHPTFLHFLYPESFLPPFPLFKQPLRQQINILSNLHLE